MKLHFPTFKKAPLQKKKRFNPHHYWSMFIIFFISVLIVELLALSWYFLYVTKKLDAPVSPTLESNASKIKSMNKMLDDTEAALKARTESTPTH